MNEDPAEEDVRDEDFYRRIIPLLPVDPDSLGDPPAAADKPLRVDTEGEPAPDVAVNIPFATLPNQYIRGPRYRAPVVSDDGGPRDRGPAIFDDELVVEFPDGTTMEWDGDPFFFKHVYEELERQREGESSE